MAEKINIEGSFDGTATYKGWDHSKEKGTPYLTFCCVDAESERYAYKDAYLSGGAKERTIKMLRDLGVQGDTDPEVVANLFRDGLVDAPCNFTTEDNEGYIRVQWLNGPGGGGREKKNPDMTDDDFIAAVFGGSAPATSAPPATASPALPAPTDDNVPF